MTAGEIVAWSIVGIGLIILVMGIVGSIRRGPTLAQRYLAASPEEKQRLDAEMARKPWLRVNMQPISGWAWVDALLAIVILVALRACIGD